MVLASEGQVRLIPWLAYYERFEQTSCPRGHVGRAILLSWDVCGREFGDLLTKAKHLRLGTGLISRSVRARLMIVCIWARKNLTTEGFTAPC